VWNVWEQPPWQSDYHLNVNLQMNYWPANNTNMQETLVALLDYIDSLRRPGRDAARLYFGVGEGYDPDEDETGWVVFLASNVFGATGLINPYDINIRYGNAPFSPESAAWIVQNVYNLYQFYPCETLLRDRIYPILRETTMFFSHPEMLIECPVSERLVMSPTYSSEHGPMWGGTTFQQQLVWQLFDFTIEAAETLDVDAELREHLAYLMDRLSPPGEDGPVPIGPVSGYPNRRPGGGNAPVGGGTVPGIREWWWEVGYGQVRNAGGDTVTIPSFQPGHRHLSHLTGLYPGN